MELETVADNKAFQKKANISLVMQTIRVNKQISRIDISRELGLDRSTITNIVSKLIEGELLVELAEGSSVSKGGRKPVLLGLNRDFGTVLGLEIQINLYRATLMNIDGSIIWNRSGNIGSSLNLYEIVSSIYTELKTYLDRNNSPLLGIGIGLPGHIDPENNTILASSPFFKESGYVEDFSKLFDFPVVLDNDANCCAWGVLEDRKEDSIKNFLYSILEFHGDREAESKLEIGFGIVINGDVYYGSNFAAGELGDDLVEDSHLIRDYNTFFTKLIKKLTQFISFLNPSHLFLGGEFINHQELITDIVGKSSINNKCEVLFSNRREFDVSFGAASMFIERLFKIPGLDNQRVTKLTWENILSLRSEKRGR
ncbi:ROK family transcriptional regulator [Thiospirochaeta perfilievii]|uniref:ROK family transcriptional regulator n=1 Tax=Thiospirochaeta perfilievii TaxID=252967 RepID=A0A5C1QBY7_9SPIO|nr:ROK family protein [Thiospirochaeta perfilievii]QEN05037.1 ROK family transcriptional regulator [Thiospirochaeta perfilievii]